MGFRNVFSSFRALETDEIFTTSRLLPGAKVEKEVEKKVLKWKDYWLKSYSVLYVVMKSVSDACFYQSDAESVEA